jgi:ABC-type glutathione transport system ATPase component
LHQIRHVRKDIDAQAIQERDMIDDKKVPSPEFPFQIAWVQNYTDLFQSKYAGKTDIEGVLNTLRKTGRVLLSGKGGAGKTSTARRLLKIAEHTSRTSFVDMKRWSLKLQEIWDHLEGDPFARMDFLLGNLGDPP